MEAFRVLPPLSGNPPPPAPPSPRVAPRYVQQKDSSAFVVLAEVGSGAPPSSPFRGRGFKGPVSSKIPVKSAPSSPGPRAPKPLVGKSAPSSPSKPTPARRFVPAKQPPSPKKTITKPTPRPRFVQKTEQKDGPSRPLLKKSGEVENKPIKKSNDPIDRITNNRKNNDKTEQAVAAPNEKEGRKVRQLNTTISVPKVTSEKASVPNASNASLPTPRGGKAAVERAAVIMDRVNRLRPERQMINSTRPIKRNSLRSRNEAAANSKVNKNINPPDPTRNGKKTTASEGKSVDPENFSQGAVEIQNPATERDILDPVHDVKILQTTIENGNERIGSQTSNVDIKPLLSENTHPSQMESSTRITNIYSPHDNAVSSSLINRDMKDSSTTNLITLTANSTGDVEDSSSTSQSSSQLTLVTGTTKVNVEPMKEAGHSDQTASQDINKSNGQNLPLNESLGKQVIEIVEGEYCPKDDVMVKSDMKTEVTPNGVLPTKAGDVNIPNGGEGLQNKIIIMQSDKNGTVKVIGSEPVSLDMEEVLRESIVTETAVPSEELLVQRQPDLIPSTQVEEPAVTVIGQPDVEVEAGNHTVTFSSPEIHPVSARPNKRKNLKELCGCCRPSKKRSKECSWRLPWFKKRNGPGPPPPPNVKKKRLAMPSILSCCNRKKKTNESKPPETKVTSEHITPSGAAQTARSQVHENNNKNLCKKIFCCGCKKKGQTLEPPRTTPKKKSYWKKLFCCCCSSKSMVRPKPQQSQELLKNRRKEMSKSRTTSIQSGFSKLEHSLVEHSSMMRAAIPVLPICLAWTCLILNIFLPGTGTMTSGIMCLCFGKPRFSVNDTAIARLGAFCINLFIGIGQIFTIIFCLVGWGWSIWWGVIMLKLARKHRRIKMAEKASEPEADQNHDVERGRR